MAGEITTPRRAQGGGGGIFRHTASSKPWSSLGRRSGSSSSHFDVKATMTPAPRSRSPRSSRPASSKACLSARPSSATEACASWSTGRSSWPRPRSRPSSVARALRSRSMQSAAGKAGSSSWPRRPSGSTWTCVSRGSRWPPARPVRPVQRPTAAPGAPLRSTAAAARKSSLPRLSSRPSAWSVVRRETSSVSSPCFESLRGTRATCFLASGLGCSRQ
mmetsp:Transcript_55461/g.161991  ORF Transcript_55461/g.161991 Transcript_55461/m.161991 type:complete len:218 (+) Transcript_55461:216-869(+)